MDKKQSNANLLKIKIKDGYVLWRGKKCKKKLDHENTIIPPYPQGMHTKTPSLYLKPWIALNPIYTLFFTYIYTYL